ncbi:MAG: peptidyl-prolyl cis-trans isomerase, EpsD family [Pseudomonadota bacterium]
MAVAASTLVIGCGKKDNTATQIVARVDGEEISVHQINTVLAKANGVTPDNLPLAKRDILEKLVNQQIAINEATAKKLDRLPEVVTAIENAKREILARAVFDQIAASQPKPTDDEAKKYYAEHPELFAQRRLFSLQEIALRKTTKDIELVRDKVATAKSMDEISAWLKDKGIEFTLNGGTRAAEQIPLEVLPKLHLFKDGQTGLLEGKDAFFITRLVASRSAPIEEAQALPRIKVFLYNQRGGEAVKVEQAALKVKAKVEYLGEFAGGEAAFKAKVEADAKAATSADAQAKVKAKADADALAKQKADEQAIAQAEAEARSKARAESRTQSGKDQKPADPSANANLEQGIKGLK